MTIWVFGDCAARHFKYLPDSWVQRTGTKLNQRIVSTVKPSSTLTYAYKKFHWLKNKFVKNDIVIISLNTLSSDWILNPHNNNNKAVDYYERFLSSMEILNEIYLVNFLYQLQYLTEKLDLHTIVLQNFMDTDRIIRPIQKDLYSIHFPIGKFGDITLNEWKPEFLNKVNPKWFAKNDVRVNHATRSNLIILSNKIINNIIKKEPIDLTTGFNTKFLDDELLKDPNFIKNELFDNFLLKVRREV